MKQFFYLLLFAYSSTVINANAQLIANGSFENTIAGCASNKSNTDFNSLVKDVTAFGAASQLDLLKDSCRFGTAQEGHYYLGIATDTFKMHDALSLSLTAQLKIGRSYKLSYYVRKADGYPATSYSIGYADIFGVQGIVATTGAGPTDTAWQMREATFSPTTAASYLTILATGNFESWTHFDHIVLTEMTTGITNVSTSTPLFTSYPIPADNFTTLHLESPFTTDAHISLIDMTGRIIKTVDVQHKLSVTIGLSDIPPGIYAIRIANAKASASSRIVVSK